MHEPTDTYAYTYSSIPVHYEARWLWQLSIIVANIQRSNRVAFYWHRKLTIINSIIHHSSGQWNLIKINFDNNDDPVSRSTDNINNHNIRYSSFLFFHAPVFLSPMRSKQINLQYFQALQYRRLFWIKPNVKWIKTLFGRKWFHFRVLTLRYNFGVIWHRTLTASKKKKKIDNIHTHIFIYMLQCT